MNKAKQVLSKASFQIEYHRGKSYKDKKNST